MILPSLCSGTPKLWSPTGRSCPSSHRRLPSQGNLLHLAQRKNTQALVCCLLGLNSEPAMDESMPDKPTKPASEIKECAASVQVDASLLRFVVGKGAKVKAKIEKDTGTQLQIPSDREAKRGSCIVVKGASQVKVDDAVSQIHGVVEEAVESSSLEYSHFISLPLAVYPDLVVQMTKFHDSVMAMLPENEKDDAIKPPLLSIWKPKSQPVKGQDLEVEKAAGIREDSIIKNKKDDAIKPPLLSIWKPKSQPVKGQDLEIEKAAGIHKDSIIKKTGFESGNVTGLSGIHVPDEEVLAQEVKQFVALAEPSAETSTKNVNEENEGDDLECFEADYSNDANDVAELPRLHTKGHGIEESIFIKPATLHLTVLMLKLWNKDRVAAAAEVLQGLKSKLLEALDHRPVAVRLKGVECMKGSSAKAHVLYARVEDVDKDSRLLSACKVIKDAFVEAGLVSEKEKKQEIKLHATLMNTSHRKRKRGKMFGKRIPFDARPILSIHGSEEWGEYTITEAHLSERFAFDEDGYYHCCGSLKLPSVDSAI